MKLNRSIFFLFLLLLFSLFISVSCKKKSQFFPENLIKVRVKKVLDGDTVILENGERLRYVSIDTPELHTSKNVLYIFAFSAYKLNKKLVEGKTFYLELSFRKRDKYRRLLGELYFENGTSVSEIIIKEGLAFVCYYPGSSKYYKKYLPLQRKALKERKGIFSLLNKQPKDIVYIGNKKSKRFHHPACPEVKKIKRKIYFKSLEEAFLKGYCPSRKCLNLIFSFL